METVEVSAMAVSNLWPAIAVFVVMAGLVLGTIRNVFR